MERRLGEGRRHQPPHRGAARDPPPLARRSIARPDAARPRSPTAWNAPTADTRTKQRLIHILIQEIVCDLDDATNEVVLLIHWTGGRHSELRVPRVKTNCGPTGPAPSAVEAIRKLASRWSRPRHRRVAQPHALQDRRRRDLDDVPRRETRERLGIAEGDPGHGDDGMISLAKAAERLKICVGSAKRLVDWGVLPATQLMPGSPWLVPSAALYPIAFARGPGRDRSTAEELRELSIR